MKKILSHKFFPYGVAVLLLLLALSQMLSLRTQRYHLSDLPEEGGMFPGSSHTSYQQQILMEEDALVGITLQFALRDTNCDDTIVLTLTDDTTGETLAVWTRNAQNFEPDDPSSKADSELADTKKIDLETALAYHTEYFMLDHVAGGLMGHTLTADMQIQLGSCEKHISVYAANQSSPLLPSLDVNNLDKGNTSLLLRVGTPALRLLYIFLFWGLCIATVGAALFFLPRFSPEKSFLLVMGILTLLYFFTIPMLQVPDERGHFFRSYEISQGDFLTPQDKQGVAISRLPANTLPAEFITDAVTSYDQILAGLDTTQNASKFNYYGNATQALYAPLSYLPQAAGCLIARLFTNRSVVIFYAGRLANTLACLALLYAAICFMPFGKRFFMLLAGMPIYIQQMVSLSSDALINALALLLLALVLHARVQGTTSKKLRIALVPLCLTIALCKVVYLPLCFLLLLLPDKKKHRLYLTILLVLCGILNVGWLVIGLGYMVEFREGVDGGKQFMGILQNPFGYLGVLLHTLWKKLIDWQGTMVGAKMCTLNVYNNLVMVVLYLAALWSDVFLLEKEEHNPLKRGEKIALSLLFFLIWGITLSSLYVQWTAVGNELVEGFQGRYFIPILPLLACACKRFHQTLFDSQTMRRLTLALVITFNLSTLFTVFTYFL